jgi:hypothetical protein
VTGPLTRLAARALGAPAPMTGNPAAAIRPRLPLRFEPDAGLPPPPEEGLNAGQIPLRPAPDPAPRTGDLRATDRSAPSSPEICVEKTPTAAPLRRPPPPPDILPADHKAPSLRPSPTTTPVAATRTVIAAAQETPPFRHAPATAPPAAHSAPQPAPPAPSRPAIPTPPAPLQPVREPPPFRPAPAAPLPERLPGAPPRAQAEAPPDIVIHIGRIDVAAPAAAAAPTRPDPTPPRHTDLGDYLRGRGTRP